MKARKSKLDAFAELIAEWELRGLKLEAMQAELKQRGCEVSLARLSVFCARLRSAADQQRLLAQIATGAAAVQQVERELARNPAPEIATLIKLYRVLILKLSTQGNTDPALLELATNMTRTALDYEKVQLKGRELALAGERFKRETCELFLKWSADTRAAEIATSPASNADKIAKLGALMFGEDWSA